MRPLYKGLFLAGIQILLVLSLGAKLLEDRATLPRVWVRAVPFDPDMPIRGRYVRLRIEAEVSRVPIPEAEWIPSPRPQRRLQPVELRIENNQLVAIPTSEVTGVFISFRQVEGSWVGVLSNELAFFIPEHVPDPSRRPAGEELWVEVTVPHKGPPRPLRLGVKKDGVITPLPLN